MTMADKWARFTENPLVVLLYSGLAVIVGIALFVPVALAAPFVLGLRAAFRRRARAT
jgi:hypothetical protein